MHCETREEGTDEYVHVYPLFGRKHVTEGLQCWCQPERDPVAPNVIIHHEEN